MITAVLPVMMQMLTNGEDILLVEFFVFQDRLAPFTVNKDLNGVPLLAKLAEEEGALTLVKQPGADGFVIDTEPLFKVWTFAPNSVLFFVFVYDFYY